MLPMLVTPVDVRSDPYRGPESRILRVQNVVPDVALEISVHLALWYMRVVVWLTFMFASVGVLCGPGRPNHFHSINDSLVPAVVFQISAAEGCVPDDGNFAVSYRVVAANKWHMACSTIA